MCLKVMDDRNMKGGMGSETNPLKFMDQDYNSLQDYCLKTRQRFIDEFFMPDSRAIGEGLLEPEVMARVEWIRPTVCYLYFNDCTPNYKCKLLQIVLKAKRSG